MRASPPPTSPRNALGPNPRRDSRARARPWSTLCVAAWALACQSGAGPREPRFSGSPGKASSGSRGEADRLSPASAERSRGGPPRHGEPVEAGQRSDTPTSWTLVSPSARLRATVELADRGGEADYPSSQRLYYAVEVKDGERFATVLEPSPLGIARDDQSLIDGLALVDAGSATRVDREYRMVTGKRLTARDLANERTISLRGRGGARVNLQLRAYDDGFAFRYRFPEASAAEHTVVEEISGFRVPRGSRAWLMPYDEPGLYTPAYEGYWQHDVAAGAPSPSSPGWGLPALFRTPSGHFALLMDTNVGPSYCAMHLRPEAEAMVYRLAFPEAGEANGLGSVLPTSTLPWSTPWRVVMAGSTAAAIVESTLATDLAEPSVLADTSWIRPGRAAWSWWSSDPSPKDFRAQLAFVDLARDMTWEYTLVDAGWEQMQGGDYAALAKYARARNVAPMLWYNSGGPHNSVLDITPRDRMDDPAIRRAELRKIAQAGVAGIKVDFFHSDKQDMMRYYAELMRDAAQAHLMINFHGATIPRGWQRTYPNLMTAEAVRGAEMYKFDPGYAADAPRRNVILAFTRNVVASMDFTPVTFSHAARPHVTTFGHELALSVVFESGLQHFADRVEAYATLPPGPRQFLARVPTTWEETRFVQGAPGEWVVLARRAGQVWYLGGIEGHGAERALELPLQFLAPGGYDAHVIADGDSDDAFSESSKQVTRADVLRVPIRARGGFVATLSPRVEPSPTR